MSSVEPKVAERFWGEEVDRLAAEQLGLDGSYTVFMMGNEIDALEDIETVEEEIRRGALFGEEILDTVREKLVRVKLPKGLRYVGMCPLEANSPKAYGVVLLPFPSPAAAKSESVSVSEAGA